MRRGRTELANTLHLVIHFRALVFASAARMVEGPAPEPFFAACFAAASSFFFCASSFLFWASSASYCPLASARPATDEKTGW